MDKADCRVSWRVASMTEVRIHVKSAAGLATADAATLAPSSRVVSKGQRLKTPALPPQAGLIGRALHEWQRHSMIWQRKLL
ncbi:hypothetical protein [Tianweitania populi]|uniref:hypothetical protein n=1 Tax=Tianweitania populi TaxID=1607949 RepID=UPI0036DE30B1